MKKNKQQNQSSPFFFFIDSDESSFTITILSFSFSLFKSLFWLDFLEFSKLSNKVVAEDPIPLVGLSNSSFLSARNISELIKWGYGIRFMVFSLLWCLKHYSLPLARLIFEAGSVYSASLFRTDEVSPRFLSLLSLILLNER